MKYITVGDLSDTIRHNLWKIPHDIDFIIGIPRSGMIAASLISSYLNVPLIDINGFLNGIEPYGGNRTTYFFQNHEKTNKVLVVDDTVYNGTSISKVKQQLKDYTQYNFIYTVVYAEKNANLVDIYLEDVRLDTFQFGSFSDNMCFYEWNMLQHADIVLKHCLFDLDGVMCVDPPDEMEEEKYLEYIKNAIPLFTPRSHIGGIVTYRLNKNREVTAEWLRSQNINYGVLAMFPGDKIEERNKISPSLFKASYYKDHPEYQLFIESDEDQARSIAYLSGKPVLCIKTNKLYNLNGR